MPKVSSLQNIRFGGDMCDLDIMGQPFRKARKRGCGLILALPGHIGCVILTTRRAPGLFKKMPNVVALIGVKCAHNPTSRNPALLC